VAAAPLPQGAFNLSTHGFGLAEAIELARALDQLPPRCVVYAVEAGSVVVGAPLSPPVAAAVPAVAARIREEIVDAAATEEGRIDA
jgi:hydrogenase maturation protease